VKVITIIDYNTTIT